MKTLLSIFLCIFAIGIASFYNSLNDTAYEYMLSRLASIPRELTSRVFSKTNATFTRTMTVENMPTAQATAFHGLPLIPPNETFSTKAPRKIQKSFLAVEQSEGAGAKVRRSIGTPQLRNFSPFLMLDHFAIPASAGFPDHPHRGRKFHHSLLNHRLDTNFLQRKQSPIFCPAQ